MDNILLKLHQIFSEKCIEAKGYTLKTSRVVIEAVEEERRRTKYQEELVERIAAANEQITSVGTENNQLSEENKSHGRKRMNSSNQLKIEQKKAEDLQATIIKEQNSKFFFYCILHYKTIANYHILMSSGLEEEERVTAAIQNKADLLLKPYQDVLGVTFQLTPKPELNLRLLFQMPGGKKSMVKVSRNGPRSKFAFILNVVNNFLC